MFYFGTLIIKKQLSIGRITHKGGAFHWRSILSFRGRYRMYFVSWVISCNEIRPQVLCVWKMILLNSIFNPKGRCISREIWLLVKLDVILCVKETQICLRVRLFLLLSTAEAYFWLLMFRKIRAYFLNLSYS